MASWRLAFALIRVPRLFASLILLPLIMSMLIVYLQLVISYSAVMSADTKSNRPEKRLEMVRSSAVIHKLMYGNEKLDELQICRWVAQPEGSPLSELPPPGCDPDRLDIALHVANPETFDPTPYAKKMKGNAPTLHLCRELCTPDVVMKVDGDRVSTHVTSFWGLGVLKLVQFSEEVYSAYLRAARVSGRSRDLLGDTWLHLAGFRQPIDVSNFLTSGLVLLNCCFLVVVALWLALRAHRKVLDYFARNGALLPMVAAIGHQPFYRAIWLVTLFRVGAFLLATVPLAIASVSTSIHRVAVKNLFAVDLPLTVLWIAAALTGLGLGTTIASIAELKHRHHLFSFLYRYLPLIITGFGALAWALTFFAETIALFSPNVIGLMRSAISSIPMFGLAPMLLAPMFKPPLWAIAVHSILSAGLIMVILRRNARWLAAHLEVL